MLTTLCFVNKVQAMFLFTIWMPNRKFTISIKKIECDKHETGTHMKKTICIKQNLLLVYLINKNMAQALFT